MAIYSLFSASGAPGVTTTAVALASRWPRDVLLVDADASASQAISAGYLRSILPHEQGLMELSAAARRDQIKAVLPGTMIQLEGTRAHFIQGPRSPQQARTLMSTWPALLATFRSLDEAGTDVIFDLGRMGLENFATPVLNGSDRAILVMRSNLPAIVGANNRVRELSTHFGSSTGQDLGLAVIGQGQPYSARDIGRKFGINKPIPVSFDAATASHFSMGSPLAKKRIGSSTLLRSVDAMISALREEHTIEEEDDDE